MAPSPTIRRLLKETAELSSSSSSPNPAFYAAPVSDADLHEWHFTLLGPPAPSPYAGGLYHGRITLPSTYPLKPPNFRFLTASGRFEVNREICLSISGFHEETWMPAWGVRTALTALRSFMAEKGTAGQIGGLEASDEVRKRLAKESREWRCENCKKTNEMVMREWWRICQEAGINVNEENLGLEGLPDGMNLVARDPNARQEEKTTSTQSDDKASSQPQPQQQIPTIIQPSPQAHPEQQSTPILHSVLPAPSPSAEAVQASAEARLTPSELAAIANSASTMHNRPMASIHSGPIAAANAALSQSGSSQPRPLQQIADSQRTSQHHTHQPIQARGQGANQTITIDRAIAGVFLALCLMVLKKIFYPAGSTTAFGVVGRDEFYLPGR